MKSSLPPFFAYSFTKRKYYELTQGPGDEMNPTFGKELTLEQVNELARDYEMRINDLEGKINELNNKYSNYDQIVSELIAVKELMKQKNEEIQDLGYELKDS